MNYTSIALLAFLLYIIFLYNNIVKLDNMVKEAWSGVNVQLKRRYELIPNLVTLAKGYMKHETKTFKEIVSLRNNAINQITPAQKEKSETKISENLKHLLVIAEQYPDLKSDVQFREISDNLADIENSLQESRRYYNATVRNYNIALNSFPCNLLAKFLGLKDLDFFEIADYETKPVEISFNEK